MNSLEMSYYNSFEVLGKSLLKLKEKHPDNPTIKEMVRAMEVIGIYSAGLRLENQTLLETLRERTKERNEAIIELRALEEKILK